MARTCQSGRCPDCKSGKWSFAGGEIDVFAFIGKNGDVVTYNCIGGNVKCEFYYWCFSLGMVWSLSVQAVGGVVEPLEKRGCQCAEDLSDWVINFGGGGGPPVGGVSTECIAGGSCKGNQIGVGVGPTLYFGVKPCKFTKIRCE